MKTIITLNDGCNSEMTIGAKLDGIFEIPMIEKPSHFIIPEEIIPFTKRKIDHGPNCAIGFNIMDDEFSEILKNPALYIGEFLKFSAVISPDCSLYRDATLTAQIINVYRNRLVGSYYQRKGIYVIPQIRWGSEYTFTTKVLPEKIAFLGVEKHSIVSIGTYGCIQSKEDKYYFKAGLEAMLGTLEPEIVLVYGSMPSSIFQDYENHTKFIQYDDWTSRMHRRD